MNLSNVTKAQLREFVDGKISKRKRDLLEEITAIVKDRMSEALKTVLGDISELERVASRFEDLLTEKIHLLGEGCVPEYSKTAAREANKIFKAHKYFLDEILYRAMNSLQNPTSSYYRFKCKPLMETYNALETELQEKLKLWSNGLNTLKTELNNAINNESTGKRAYNALVALGVDMSDLPEVNPNLPAVVKLSVDVCVLNGDCDKKESA